MSKNLVVCILFLNVGLFYPGNFLMANSPSDSKYMSETEYQNALIAQNKIHNFIRIATRYETLGQHSRALENYLKAYEINKCAGLVAVCRGAIADNYEAIGEYEKALEYVEDALQRLNASPQQPAYIRYKETKQRLLQKIDAQKRGEKVEEPKTATMTNQPIRNIADFQKAGYGSQKNFMEQELPENTEILRLSKQAMLAEHAGKFQEAKGFYEQLLAQKDGVTAAQGEVAWVMLHCAVQRTSEVTGDEAREKEMLVWIRDNMFSSQGYYHKYLAGLLPAVQDHLKKRINEK